MKPTKCPDCGGPRFFHRDNHRLDNFYIRNRKKGDNLFTPTGKMAVACNGCKVAYLLDDEVKP